MTFENPVWLTLTPLIVLTIAGLVAFGLRRREALLVQFVAARLLDQLTETTSLQRTWVKTCLLLFACACIGIALARPQYGVEFVERKARGLDLVFVLDSSKSMLATDIRPSRLERAKLAIIDLVNRLESDRIGLVAFAGSAFLQTPPTLDYSAFRENLNSIGPGIISRGGSNLGQALREAVKAFPQDNNFKVVVLLTDGEDLSAQAIDTAREIAKDGIKVYSIGIGTPEGTYLKVRNNDGIEEYVRDASGQPVRSQLDEATLQKIAQLTGGSYSRLVDQSLETLYNSVLATLPRQERESELQETRIERYQWALLAAVICLILESLILRRSKTSAQIAAVFVSFSLFSPTPSRANDTVDLQPEEIVEDIAEKPITDPRVLYNQAHEYFVDGDYPIAQTYYEQALERGKNLDLKRDTLYNLAHVSNQLGEIALQEQDYETAIENWKQAEALFQSVSEIDPNDTTGQEDAKKLESRRKALEEFLEQQQSQDQPSSSDENEQNQQDSESQSGENQQDQSSESSSEDSSSSDESTSNDDTSESSSSENQENSSGESDSDQENSQSETESDDSETSGQDESTQQAQADGDENNAGESSGDPVEDMQQADEQTAGDETDEAEQTEQSETDSVETSNAVEPTSDDTSAGSEEQSAGAIVEGMRISEAEALLDSLRNNERLLPFTDRSDQAGQKSETRDW